MKTFLTFIFIIFILSSSRSQSYFQDDKFMMENDTLEMEVLYKENCVKLVTIRVDIDNSDLLQPSERFEPNFSGKIFVYGTVDIGKNYELLLIDDIEIPINYKDKFKYFHIDKLKFPIVKILIVSNSSDQKAIVDLQVNFFKY